MTLVRAVSLLLSTISFSLLLAAQTVNPEPPGRVFTSIAGVVATHDGSPVPDARVEAYDTATRDVVASAYSGQNGVFVIRDVPLGSYEVEAQSGFAATRTTVQLKSPGSAADRIKLLLPRSRKVNPKRPDDPATVSVIQLRTSGKVAKLISQTRQAMHEDKNDEASRYVDEALRIDPDNSEALTFRGLLKMRRADNDGALDDLDRSLKADSHQALTYLGLGAVFNRMEQYDDAERALDRATTLDPSSWQAYVELAKTMLSKDNYRRALGFVDRAQALAPKDFPPVHLIRANALMGLKDFGAAATELQAYVDRDRSKEKEVLARAKQMIHRIRSEILKLPESDASNGVLMSSGDQP